MDSNHMPKMGSDNNITRSSSIGVRWINVLQITTMDVCIRFFMDIRDICIRFKDAVQYANH
jgi:hypothetical protein